MTLSDADACSYLGSPTAYNPTARSRLRTLDQKRDVDIIFMKLFLSLLSLFSAVLALQWYPLNQKGEVPQIEPYVRGQDVFIDCIARNIDTGEHKFDSGGRIVHTSFPTCKETGKPLAFRYGVLEDVNCTFDLSDELYHMFQLYVHEDAPWSCRIPLSSAAHSVEQGGAYIPLTFNLRGEVHESHMDIDTRMNMIVVTPHSRDPAHQSVVSAVAWSSGTRAIRTVIGDSLTLQVAVRWMDNVRNYGAVEQEGLPYGDGYYKLPFHSVPVSYAQYFATLAMVAVVAGVAVYGATYKLRRMPNLLDSEAGFAKQD